MDKLFSMIGADVFGKNEGINQGKQNGRTVVKMGVGREQLVVLR